MNEDVIIKYLSYSRIDTYDELVLTKFTNIDSPLELYKINMEISKNIYELLSYFEIFLRNKIDIVFTKTFGINWFNRIAWRDKHKEQIYEIEQKLKDRKIKHNKDYDKNDIISGLQLGFWIHLFDKNYQSTLWYGSLNTVFPRKTNRQSISAMLDGIGKLRNRVSHYETIIKDTSKLNSNISNIMFFIETIDKNLYNWIKTNNSVTNLNKIISENF